MTLYKWTALDGSSCNGGSGRWPLPTQNDDGTWKPGAWRRLIKNIEPCARDYHLCRDQDLLWWIGPALWEAEAEGEPIEHGSAATEDTKIVVSHARLLRPATTWNERTARLFAADCAEQVLPVFEARHPGDSRPRRAIEVARAYARGSATVDELAAAGTAAWTAAGTAAWTAAWASAWASAWAAAGTATGTAARDAAGDAAWAAAWDAAGAAAWDAAGTATGTAARDAAGDAAWAAAGDAARAAAREWQHGRLVEYITGGAS